MSKRIDDADLVEITGGNSSISDINDSGIAGVRVGGSEQNSETKPSSGGVGGIPLDTDSESNGNSEMG